MKVRHSRPSRLDDRQLQLEQALQSSRENRVRNRLALSITTQRLKSEEGYLVQTAAKRQQLIAQNRQFQKEIGDINEKLVILNGHTQTILAVIERLQDDRIILQERLQECQEIGTIQWEIKRCEQAIHRKDGAIKPSCSSCNRQRNSENMAFAELVRNAD